ncbi:hypothetical protein MD484_g6935, partial [Candolleomyces efflorescens]
MTQAQKPFLREAKFPEDFDAILEVSRKAFQLDPAVMFWGNVKEITPTGLTEEDDKRLLTFLSFLLRCCIDYKARITVVVYPEGEGAGKIVSAAYWMPPKKRIQLYHVRRLIRAGFFPLFRAWGLTGFDRVNAQHIDVAHKAFQDAFKKRGFRSSSVDSTAWHLALVMTDPEYQGRGFLSMIVREQFEFDSDGIYLLEATTLKSRDQYAHLGFETRPTAMLMNFGFQC